MHVRSVHHVSFGTSIEKRLMMNSRVFENVCIYNLFINFLFLVQDLHQIFYTERFSNINNVKAYYFFWFMLVIGEIKFKHLLYFHT